MLHRPVCVIWVSSLRRDCSYHTSCALNALWRGDKGMRRSSLITNRQWNSLAMMVTTVLVWILFPNSNSFQHSSTFLQVLTDQCWSWMKMFSSYAEHGFIQPKPSQTPVPEGHVSQQASSWRHFSCTTQFSNFGPGEPLNSRRCAEVLLRNCSLSQHWHIIQRLHGYCMVACYLA